MAEKRYDDFVANLRGGKKQMWLRVNHPLILWYLHLFGYEDTKRRFHLTHDTLEQLEKRSEKPYGFRLAKPDKAVAMAEIAIEGQRTISERMNKLEDAFAEFTQVVGQNVGGSIGQDLSRFVTLLLQSRIEVTPTLEVGDEPDPLNIETLTSQALKH